MGFALPKPTCGTCTTTGIDTCVGCPSDDSGGGGAGTTTITAQILIYTGEDPGALTPDYPTLPAIAYHLTGAGPVFTWNTTTQAWV